MNELLQAARKKKCWSIERASAEINVSVRTYQRWEHGQVLPHLSSLQMLCDAFEMSPGDLGYADLLAVPSEQPPFIEQQAITTIQTPFLFEAGILALFFAQYQQNWTLDELAAQAELAIRRFGTMRLTTDDQNISRRGVLTLLVGLPIGILAISQPSSSSAISTEETLSLYAAAVPACWHLYFAGERPRILNALPAYLTQLTALASQRSQYEKVAASLASQVYQLGSLLALEQEDFGTALHRCKQGLDFAQLAGDPNLQVASLMRKVDVLLFRKRPEERLQALREAKQLIGDVSPLLSGRIYSGLAEVYANRGQAQLALRYAGLAQDTYPAEPENDPNFFYTYANHYILYTDTGLAYQYLGKYKESMQAFAQANRLVPATPNARYIELRCWQARSSVGAGDMEQSSGYLQDALSAAQTLNSSMYVNESYEVYQSMQSKWKKEPKVKSLAELFQY